MSHASIARTPPADWPTELQVLVAAIGFETVLLVGYFLVTDATVTTPRYVVYPFLWINAVLWAGMRIPFPSASRRHHAVALGVALAYFLLLANWAGLITLTGGGHHPVPDSILGLSVGSGSPGWARVRFITRTVAVSFVPFRVIGYLGLAYLVYAAVLDVTGAVASGAIGLLSCLSCSFPILASVVTGLWGGSVTLMSTVFAHSTDFSTLAFLVSVGLLYWRPGFPSLGFLQGDDAGSRQQDASGDESESE
ncbi:MAG: hypothetical protein V5A44_05780 [Haloarculaceae archaeon]